MWRARSCSRSPSRWRIPSRQSCLSRRPSASAHRNHLRELADAYKEAQVAIEVGKVFDTEKSILSYENLVSGD